MTGIAFALGAAFGYAALDLLRKLLADRLDPLALLAWMTILPAPLFAAWLVASGAGWPEPGYWAWGLTSSALNIAANVCFLFSVRSAGLGSTIPVLALTPVFSSVIAVPLLGELPGPSRVLGILLVVTGVAWLYRAAAPRGGESRSDRHALGMALMVVVAVCWSAATPLDRLALRWASPAFHGLILHLVIAVAMLATLAHQGNLGRLGAARPFAGLLALTVLVSATALVLQLYALQHLWAGLVETVKRGLGSVSALVLGVVLLGEPFSRQRALAVALTIAGVALVLIQP